MDEQQLIQDDEKKYILSDRQELGEGVMITNWSILIRNYSYSVGCKNVLFIFFKISLFSVLCQGGYWKKK